MTTRTPQIPGFSDFTLIGRGGFGAVYKAHQETLGREVAIKVLFGAQVDDRARKRFAREQRAMGALSQNPGIVTLYESGFTGDGQPYLAMELMESGSLTDRLIAEGPMPWETATALIARVANAVAEAHDAGVLHRDIKPENVLVSRYGDPKLTDFGISAFMDGVATATTTITATVEHAAPEVLDGAPPTVRSDVYSLGSTLYTLIAGHSPFRRTAEDSMLSILKRVSVDPIPALPGEVPHALQELMSSSLAKDPDRRPPSAHEMADALSALGSVPPGELARSSTGAERSAQSRRVIGGAGERSPTRATPRRTRRPSVRATKPKSARRNGLAQMGIGAIIVLLAAVASAVGWNAFRSDGQAAAVAAETTSTAAATTTSSSSSLTTPITAPTTTSTTISTTTTVAPTTTYGIGGNPRSFPAPGNDDERQPLGAGCDVSPAVAWWRSSDSEPLPDGAWFGRVLEATVRTDVAQLEMILDVTCFWGVSDGNSYGGVIEKGEPSLYSENALSIEVDANAIAYWSNEQGVFEEAGFITWLEESELPNVFVPGSRHIKCPSEWCSVFAYVNGGVVTEIVVADFYAP